MPLQDFSNQFQGQADALLQQLKPSPEFYFLIVCFFLLFVRTIAMVIVTPFLGSKSVPGRAKVMIAIALTSFIYPVLKSSFVLSEFSGFNGALFGLFLKEAMVGFAIGFTISLVFYGIQAAGLMIDNQRGAANAQIFVPQLGTQGSIFGMFQFQAAIALFLVIGGHRLFLRAFFESFVVLPIFHLPNFEMGDGSFLNLLIHLTANVLILAVKLSAPIVIGIFLADVVLGITNKVAPSINVFELGFSIKGVAGVIIVYVSIIVLYQEFAGTTLEMVDTLREAIKILGR